MNRVELIYLQKIILEKLFPDNWFTNRPHVLHPAYKRWSFCNDLLKRNGVIKYPEQKDALFDFGRVLLDSSVFITLTEGRLDAFSLGSFNAIGNTTVQTFIRTRITSYTQFEDIMVELAFGAWHKSSKHDVTLIENDGCPDLEIKIPGIELPFMVECKKIKSKSTNRLNKEINDANKKIKSTQKNCYGIAVLDISEIISVQQVDNDDYPSTVSSIIPIIQSALSGNKNRSVSDAILIWDDYRVLGAPPNKTLIVFRRRNIIIKHTSSNKKPPETCPLYNGFTVVNVLNWEPRQEGRKNYIFSDLFLKECQDRFNITRQDAAEAVHYFDKNEPLIIEDSKKVSLFARHKKKSSKEFYLLVCAEEVGKTEMLVLFALKIPINLYKEIHLLSPISLLARVANEFGMTLQVGEIASKFILFHKIRVQDVGLANIVNIVNPENHPYLNSFFMKIEQESGGGFADCRCMFCIDLLKYSSCL